MKDESEIRLEVLMHESQQVHETLGRALAVANALFGAVLPVAVGFLLYTAGKGDTALPLDVLAVGLAAVVTLTVIFNVGLWVEISRYMHYKYVKPKIGSTRIVPSRQSGDVSRLTLTAC